VQGAGREELAGILNREAGSWRRRPARGEGDHQDEPQGQHQGMAHQRQGRPHSSGSNSGQEMRPAASESTIPKDRSSGPVGNHKIVESGASQPQDMGVSLRQDSNDGCNVQGAFPPSVGQRQSASGPVKTRGRRGATTRRNGPSSTLPQPVGGPSSGLQGLQQAPEQLGPL